MLESFRLPPLVLGVSIKADTSGARQAARELRDAINREMGGLRGPVGGNGGGGGNGGNGGFGGNMLGSAVGTSLVSATNSALRSKRNLKTQFGLYQSELGSAKFWSGLIEEGRDIIMPMMNKTLSRVIEKDIVNQSHEKWSAYKAAISRSPFLVRSRGGRFRSKLSDLWWGAVLGRTNPREGKPRWRNADLFDHDPMGPYEMEGGGLPIGWKGKWGGASTRGDYLKEFMRTSPKALKNDMMLVFGSVRRSLLSFGDRLTSMLTFKSIGMGGGGGFLGSLRGARSIWHLIIGTLVLGAIKEAVAMMRPALEFIRRTGAGGQFGEFSRQAYIAEIALKNVAVQVGLAAIKLLDLDKVLSGFNHILLQLASVLEWMGNQAWLKKIIKWQNEFNPVMAPTNITWKLLQWLGTGKGGAGPGDLPGGGMMPLIPRLAGAMMEGSVQAYSAIQQSLVNYAAQTAINTKDMADAMKRLVENQGALGVVHG